MPLHPTIRRGSIIDCLNVDDPILDIFRLVRRWSTTGSLASSSPPFVGTRNDDESRAALPLSFDLICVLDEGRVPLPSDISSASQPSMGNAPEDVPSREWARLGRRAIGIDGGGDGRP